MIFSEVPWVLVISSLITFFCWKVRKKKKKKIKLKPKAIRSETTRIFYKTWIVISSAICMILTFSLKNSNFQHLQHVTSPRRILYLDSTIYFKDFHQFTFGHNLVNNFLKAPELMAFTNTDISTLSRSRGKFLDTSKCSSRNYQQLCLSSYCRLFSNLYGNHSFEVRMLSRTDKQSHKCMFFDSFLRPQPFTTHHLSHQLILISATTASNQSENVNYL